MKSLTNPTTLEEFFDVTNVDEELRPRYRKWLEDIFVGMIPEDKRGSGDAEENPVGFGAVMGYNQCISDIKENIMRHFVAIREKK